MTNFAATCHVHETLFTTSDPDELTAHLTQDGRKPKAWYDHGGPGGPTPTWVRNASKPWRPPGRKTFAPKPGDPGSEITFKHDGRPMTAQVWSAADYPNHVWAVADQIAYLVDVKHGQSKRYNIWGRRVA